MIACVDVHYEASEATAACVLFETWDSASPCFETTTQLEKVAEYEPGRFYLRELPCILAVLRGVTDPIETIVIDGYVWLDDQRPGLGAHLYEMLGRSTVVVGIAKNPFDGAAAVPVCRGRSKKPLLVGAAGITAEKAASLVATMHGGHRIPTLVRYADRLARGLGR
jgi:deoxyribonuclease V